MPLDCSKLDAIAEKLADAAKRVDAFCAARSDASIELKTLKANLKEAQRQEQQANARGAPHLAQEAMRKALDLQQKIAMLEARSDAHGKWRGARKAKTVLKSREGSAIRKDADSYDSKTFGELKELYAVACRSGSDSPKAKALRAELDKRSAGGVRPTKAAYGRKNAGDEKSRLTGGPTGFLNGEQYEHKHNAEAVQNAINKDKRIKGKEGRMIHALLRGRS